MTLEIHADVLTRHADRLDDLAGRISTQSCAVTAVDLDDGCFGLMNAWMPPIVSALFCVQGDTVQAHADFVARAAEEVRETAHDFTFTDQDVAHIYGGGS